MFLVCTSPGKKTIAGIAIAGLGFAGLSGVADAKPDTLNDDPEALVFTSPQGQPLRSVWRRRFWFPAVEAAGLPAGLRIHDLRHTAAALMIANGANVRAVQQQLGHSSATVTLDNYGHLSPDELDRLAAGLDRTRSDAIADYSRTFRGPEVVNLSR